MSIPEWTAFLVAASAVIAALTALLRQAQATHQLINSRMTELLAATHAAALAQGKLEGPDGHPPNA